MSKYRHGRRHALAAIALTTLVATGQPAIASPDYPQRPVTVIVPFPAGGTSDVMGRLIADALARELWDPLESTCRHASLSIL